MAWSVYGKPWDTAEMSNTALSVKASVDVSTILKAARTWIIVYNDPPFTSLNMKIYSNDGTSPKKLIATSTNTLLKAQIHTLANAVKEVFFQFDDVNLKAGDSYHFVINGVGYTGTTSSHLAWRHAWPDPVYQYTGLGYLSLAVSPFEIYFIGANL